MATKKGGERVIVYNRGQPNKCVLTGKSDNSASFSVVNTTSYKIEEGTGDLYGHNKDCIGGIELGDGHIMGAVDRKEAIRQDNEDNCVERSDKVEVSEDELENTIAHLTSMVNEDDKSSWITKVIDEARGSATY